MTHRSLDATCLLFEQLHLHSTLLSGPLWSCHPALFLLVLKALDKPTKNWSYRRLDSFLGGGLVLRWLWFSLRFSFSRWRSGVGGLHSGLFNWKSLALSYFFKVNDLVFLHKHFRCVHLKTIMLKDCSSPQRIAFFASFFSTGQLDGWCTHTYLLTPHLAECIPHAISPSEVAY